MADEFKINYKRLNPWELNQYLNRMTQGWEQGPNIKKVVKARANEVNDALNQLYSNTKDFKTEVTKGAKAATKAVKGSSAAVKAGNALKFVGKYAPLTGDVYDIYHGAQRLQNGGNPWVGVGEIGLGLGGLATLGTGSLAKSAVKGGVKTLLNAGVKKGAIRAASKPVKFMASHPIVGNAIPSIILNNIPDDYTNGVTPDQAQAIQQALQQSNDGQVPLEPLEGDPGDQINPVQNVPSLGYRTANYPQGGGDIGDFIRANQSYNNYQGDNGQGYDLQSIPLPQTTGYAQGQQYQDMLNGMGVQAPLAMGQPTTPQTTVDTAKLNEVLAQYQKDLEAQNAPYTAALENYLRNYDEYIRQGLRNKRYWTGYANLHSKPEQFAQSMGKAMEGYEPLELEAKRVDLIKSLADQQAAIPTAMRQMKGNIALASQLGLPPEAMIADPSLLKISATYNKSYNDLLGKMYGADLGYRGKVYTADRGYDKGVDVANIFAGSRNYGNELAYNAKLYAAQLDAQIQWAIQNNKADLARDLMAQKVKLGGLQSAMGSAPFMNDPSQLQPYLDALGIQVNYQPAAGLNEQGLAQPAQQVPATAVTPQRMPQGMTPAQALYYTNRGR